MPNDLLDILRHYLFGEASVFLLLCGKNGRIMDTNSYTKDFIGFDPVLRRINDVIIDFHKQFNLSKLASDNKIEVLLNIKTFTGLPQSIYVKVFDLQSNYLILGRRDVKEQENLRKEIINLNNDLHSITRTLHKQKSELEKLNKLKDRFLGMAAHDLRKPAGVIMNFSEFLLEDLEDNLDQEHIGFLKRIIHSSQYMTNIINDFLDVALIEAGNFPLNLEAASFSKLIKENVKQHNFIAKKENIEIILNIPDNDIVLNIDPAKIEQVINNLISNAIEHSQIDSKISIDCIVEENSVVLKVIDNGPGIEPDKQKEIFDIFKRDSKKLRGNKSSGLGLAISKKIIDSHNGKIWVESKMGEGSCFCFSIPK